MSSALERRVADLERRKKEPDQAPLIVWEIRGETVTDKLPEGNRRPVIIVRYQGDHHANEDTDNAA